MTFSSVVFAQNSNFKSIHQEQNEYFNQFQIQNDTDWESIRGPFKPNGRIPSKACNLNKIVFGWHPYWSNGLEGNYDWTLLTDLSYFSYEVDAATGNANTTHGWSTANAVTQALANGVRVNLCVTLFSNHATFFASSTSKQTLITNLINLVQSRGANGVNIDFEGVPSSQKTQLTNFLVDLCNQMHTAIPGSQVSVCLYAVDWSTVFDNPVLNNYIDLFIIMGYDYYYGGSSTAGPTSGLFSLTSSYNYNCSKSINSYLNSGVSPEKLVLGLPYFGFDWPTTSGALLSSTTGSGSAKFYNTVMNNASGYYSSANRQFNMDSYVPYFAYNNGSWHQCWMDDAFSLGKKFELVHKRGIAGIGIWALGYDDGYPELWDKIKEKLTTCREDACMDTIYDMGGPSWNYYDKEDYYYTIAPTNASSVTIDFQSFNLEAGFDSIWFYDGPDITSPLIGGYSGTVIPGQVSSTGPEITLRFHSDNATNRPGYTAKWQCITDNISPTTSIATPIPWISQNFTATFTDNDNINGTGVEKSFYNISDFDGTNWNANTTNGFFRDEFDIIQPNWDQATGVWSINSGKLSFTDETQGNSNIYAALNQTLSNRYVYHFNASAGGTAASRRFGFHFFSDNASLPNRGNSYFIWFRIDDQSLQFYKVINDTYSLEYTITGITTTPSQNYDYKVSYDRILGNISVWRDDQYLGGWTDPSPFSSNGNYISFRTGNCTLNVDYINVYRSRNATTNISIGNASADIRYQNPNPATPSANVKSLVVDGNHNLSSIVSNDLNIDWTPPNDPTWVFDGGGSDVDTTFSNNQLTGNWSNSSDPNSGFLNFEYSFGTAPGDFSITGAWIDNLVSNSVVQNALSLSYNTTYFLNVKARNNAGLYSNIVSSDGILVLQAGSPPVVNFQTNDSVICTGQTISFVNQTTQGGSYYWIFDGGNPINSSLQDPTVTYNVPGTYSVTLISTNNDGSDTLVRSGYIVVNESPVSNFSLNPSSGQPPLPVIFTNLSSGANNYFWEFGDGNFSTDQDPYNIYTSHGTFIVSLISSNLYCPSDTMTDTVFVGLSDIYSANTGHFRIFPNPASDEINIENFNENIDEVLIEIISIDGKEKIYSSKAYNSQKVKIKVGHLKKGNYILKLQYRDKSYFRIIEIINK